MTIEQLVDQLVAARVGARNLDIEIAQVIGWKRATEPVIDATTGEKRNKTLWLVPKTEDPGKVPAYTTSIDAACELAQMVAPAHVGGCSWEADRASARIGADGPYVQARTPALAICIAALLLRKSIS